MAYNYATKWVIIGHNWVIIGYNSSMKCEIAGPQICHQMGYNPLRRNGLHRLLVGRTSLIVQWRTNRNAVRDGHATVIETEMYTQSCRSRHMFCPFTLMRLKGFWLELFRIQVHHNRGKTGKTATERRKQGGRVLLAIIMILSGFRANASFLGTPCGLEVHPVI